MVTKVALLQLINKIFFSTTQIFVVFLNIPKYMYIKLVVLKGVQCKS